MGISWKERKKELVIDYLALIRRLAHEKKRIVGMQLGRGRHVVLPAWYKAQMGNDPSLQGSDLAPQLQNLPLNHNRNSPNSYNDQDMHRHPRNQSPPRRRSPSPQPILENSVPKPIEAWINLRCTPYKPRPTQEDQVIPLFDSHCELIDLHRDRRLSRPQIVDKLFCRGPDQVTVPRRLLLKSRNSIFSLECEIHTYTGDSNSDYFIVLYQIKYGVIYNMWLCNDSQKTGMEKSIPQEQWLSDSSVKRLLYKAEDKGADIKGTVFYQEF